MRREVRLVVSLAIMAGLLSVLTISSRGPQSLATPTATPSQLIVVTASEALDHPGFGQVTPTPGPTPSLTPTPKPSISPEMYTSLITLEIPAIDVYTKLEAALPIEEGDELDFSKIHEAPLWVSCTRKIGEPGTALVLGHRQWGPNPKVFARLDQLETGDIVHVTTSQYVFHFTIQEANVVVDPENVWETIGKYDTQATEINQSILVLLTCTPYGTDWQRLMVFANLEEVYEN